ncbi:MAG: C-type lectin domain-containing protein [Deltaproteobacteria bacterium]|nr:C-type lectin domain-containing protein [Deltaproteobacteria bacterium]
MDVRYVLFVPLLLGGCSPLVERYDGHDYLFSSGHRDWNTWEGAREDCASRGYHLVDVEDADENAWITAVARVYSATEWWLGLNDREDESVWVWESGFTGQFSYWASGVPDVSGGSDCAVLSAREDWDTGESAGGRWRDAQCGEWFPFVCERETP